MADDDLIKSAQKAAEQLATLVSELQEAISNEDDTEIQRAADVLARVVEGLRVMLEPQE
jgi:uncharacterized protein YlxW (UPF0749 family)